MFMQVRYRGSGVNKDQVVIINTDAIYLITCIPGMMPEKLYEVWIGESSDVSGRIIVDQTDANRIFGVIGVGL